MFAIFIPILFLIPNGHGANVPTEDQLHNVMSDSELMRYFQTTKRDAVPDYEVVYLPDVSSIREGLGGESEIEYRFSAFERPLDLKLKRNSDIVSPAFKTYIHDEDGTKFFNATPTDCHYLHEDANLVAALSICSPKTVHGLIFADNSTFEIQPLTSKLQRLTKRQAPDIGDARIPHIIKRAKFESDFLLDDLFPTADNLVEFMKQTRRKVKIVQIFGFRMSDVARDDIVEMEELFKGTLWSRNGALQSNGLENLLGEEIFENADQHDSFKGRGRILTAEIALFFDEAAYKIFAPYFGYNDRKLQNMLLAYINGVQALYHHPSLGTSLELVLVRLDVMKTQPREMPHYNGERSQLLDSFCQYQSGLNRKDDSDPDHWDMALYVSGLDFYAYENGKKSDVTMGLATVGGVCLDKYACVIAEFGTTNVFGKPYPSAGFTSVYILAHEIGHNLGMHHDSSANSCPKEGYIMSPSRGTNGETQWSTCSAQVMSKLDRVKCLQDSAKPLRGKDHSRFLDIPGRVYTAKKQCEILLRDKDAAMSPSQQQSDICYNLQCKTPHRSGYYFAGPALDGTPCGTSKYCWGGYCSSKQPPKPVKVVPGGWSSWQQNACASGCVQKAKGIQISTRECNNPVPANTDQGCEGSNREYNICHDDKICSAKRKSPVEYASMKCKEFSNLLPELDPKGAGLQAPHEDARVWTSCAIFCKRKDSSAFYTPRIELNDLGVSPYFPDGTWCHKDTTGMNYYCMHHHCLPENFKFTKNQMPPSLDDIPFSQNARPNRPIIPPSLKNYFALGPNGRPIQTSFKTSDLYPAHEEEWETKDYVELPSIERRFDALVQEMDDLNLL